MANGGGAYESRSSRKIDGVDVSQRIDDYGVSSGTLLAVEELRYLMRQPFYLAGILAIFTRTLCGTRSLADTSETGDTYESQEMLGHSSAVDTQRYLYGLDGQEALML